LVLWPVFSEEPIGFGALARHHSMQERKHVRIEYRLRPNVDVEAYWRRLKEFVAAMRAHDPSHEYTAFRDANDDRHFVHVGHFDPAIAEQMQAQPWFAAYTTHLRTLTVEPPNVTMLNTIASTRAS
jgi:quinol monooxygenase YgiN